MSLVQSPNFLRAVLYADAAASGATALLVIAGAGLLAPLLQLPEGLLLEAGLVLIPFVAFVLYVATRPVMPRLAVQAIAEINFVWAIGSIVLLLSGWVQPNALGIVFVAGQALAVAALGVAQYVALKAQPR